MSPGTPSSKHNLRTVLRFWGARPKDDTTLANPYHDLRLHHPIRDPIWIERFEAWMRGRGSSPQTRNHYRSVLRGLYKTALLPAYRAASGVTVNRFRDVPRDTVVERTVTISIEDLRSWLKNASYHVRLAVAIAALAPKLRLANVLALTWHEHIDPDFRFITVHHHKTSGIPTLVFRVAFGVLRHRQDAEDVAQEALIKAHRSFRQLRDRERFRAWLVRLTWRLAVNRQRADRRRTARELEHVWPSAIPTAGEAVLARERTALVWQAIDKLPEKQRIVVVLAGIEGHDIEEVARLLGLPHGTVKSRLFLARQRLKEHLQCTLSDPRTR